MHFYIRDFLLILHEMVIVFPRNQVRSDLTSLVRDRQIFGEMLCFRSSVTLRPDKKNWRRVSLVRRRAFSSPLDFRKRIRFDY